MDHSRARTLETTHKRRTRTEHDSASPEQNTGKYFSKNSVLRIPQNGHTLLECPTKVIMVLVLTALLIVPNQQVRTPSLGERISQFCFQDQDTGTWIAIYNNKGTYELLQGYNNTCKLKPAQLIFHKTAF